jgi:hypothetical protein
MIEKEKLRQIKELIQSTDLQTNRIRFDSNQLMTLLDDLSSETLPEVVIRSQIDYWTDEMLEDVKHLKESLIKLKKLDKNIGKGGVSNAKTK